MSGDDPDSARHDEPHDAVSKPIIPPRNATAQQAMIAITFVFFVGVLIGFVLGRTM